MRCKYTDEVRLCIGVAVITPIGPNGESIEREGRRIQPFDYSRSVLLSVSDFEKKIKVEIDRVKMLRHGESSGWVVRDKSPILYMNDSLLKLKKCGKVACERLKNVGVLTISDLQNISAEQIQKLGSIKMGAKQVEDLKNQADRADPKNRPDDIDFRKASNPYLARYGNAWREICEGTHFMKQYCCVTKMVDHIFEETRKTFLNTTHEKDWMLYHDALSLMTAKECRSYMKAKGYEEHWILPEENLFHDDPSLRAYRGRPVGNSPELCCLDSSLNKDIHEAVNRHIQLTHDFDKDDSRKFRMDTPLHGANAYKRILDPSKLGIAPTSDRIIQDTEGVMTSIMMIIKAKGTVVADINNRTGKRREKGIY